MRVITAILVCSSLTLLAMLSNSWAAGVPCVGTSDVWAASDSACVGDTVELYVIVRDCYGQPLSNRVCYFYTGRGDVDSIMGSPDTTDASGFAAAAVSSHASGQCWTYVNCMGVALGGTMSITWDPGVARKAVPNHGWALAPPREDPGWPFSWVHILSIGNDDPADTLVLKNLVIAVRPGPIDMASLELFTDWDSTLVGSGGMYIMPDTTIEWKIIGPAGPIADSQHVYGHYEIWNVAGPETQPPVETWFDHYAFFDDLGGIGPGVTDAADFVLMQNRPNPFDGTTEIRYALPVACKVNLAIYNTLGQRVKTAVDRYQAPGLKSVHWDGRNQSGHRVSSGVYFYRLEAGEYLRTRKMVLMR